MTPLILVLRTVSLLGFAAPLMLGASARARSGTDTLRRGVSRAPIAANFATFGAFLISLLVFRGSPEGLTALLLASSGALLAVGGAGLVLRSRAALGPAWSFEPVADQATGLVTVGPYRRVRHPIYLGLALIAMGNAFAFSNCPAALTVLGGIVPTFAWRVHAEETLLRRTFGERYRQYQRHTKLIIPHVL